MRLTPEASQGLLKAQQVADLLGVHLNTVKRIDPSLLPYYRLGTRGDRRYRMEDIEMYLQESRIDA